MGGDGGEGSQINTLKDSFWRLWRGLNMRGWGA